MIPKHKLHALQQRIREKNKPTEEILYFRDCWRELQKSGLNDLDTNLPMAPPTCKCGRPFDCLRNLHCPLCGSISLVAVAKHGEFRNWRVEGELVVKVYAVGYSCRRCQFVFTDMDTFLSCEAPPLQPTMKNIRQQENAKKALKEAGFTDVDDFKAQLARYQAKKKPN